MAFWLSGFPSVRPYVWLPAAGLVLVFVQDLVPDLVLHQDIDLVLVPVSVLPPPSPVVGGY